MLTTIISEDRILMTTNLGNNLWNFTMQIQSNISIFQEKHTKKKSGKILHDSNKT